MHTAQLRMMWSREPGLTARSYSMRLSNHLGELKIERASEATGNVVLSVDEISASAWNNPYQT